MIKNGTDPFKLLVASRRAGRPLVRREDLRALAPHVSNPDRAVARLVAEGLVERIGRGVWLIPSGVRPRFEIPRFWSNPDLDDPRTIAALVVSNPRLRDVVRAMLAYGSRALEGALSDLVDAREISASTAETSARMIMSAKEGLRDAARRRPAT